MKLLWFLFFLFFFFYFFFCYYFHDLYIASCFFFYSQSTIICSESVVSMWFEVWFGYDVRFEVCLLLTVKISQQWQLKSFRCLCCWIWAGKWRKWVSNVFEDCCIYICLFNKKYKNCKWKEKEISNRNHSENLIKVKLK